MELKRIRLQIDLGFDALAARPADVLEEAKALQPRTWDRQDVVVIGGAEGADLPAERADIQFLGAAEARFHGPGYDLLQRRIGDQECPMMQGLVGSAQPSSSGVGARLASE